MAPRKTKLYPGKGASSHSYKIHQTQQSAIARQQPAGAAYSPSGSNKCAWGKTHLLQDPI
eukprot:scaffold6358_cov80-Cylindrotheca_fusiformis.AAC.3